MKVYYGIDPGKTGAIARIDNNHIFFFDAENINVIKDFSEEFSSFIEVFCAIEKAQVMPKQRSQGAVGMFRYGVSYGKYLGMLQVLRIPYAEIHPMTWKKEFSLIHQPKEKSIAVAIQLFPQAADHLKRKKDHGRAEALLLAEYARRKNM